MFVSFIKVNNVQFVTQLYFAITNAVSYFSVVINYVLNENSSPPSTELFNERLQDHSSIDFRWQMSVSILHYIINIGFICDL